MVSCLSLNLNVSDTPRKFVNTNDDSAAWVECVKSAAAEGSPLRIVGGDSKRALGNHLTGNTDATLNTTTHTGVIEYEPTELVVTVRTGTSLAQLNQTLSEAGQMLPFEPPVFAGSTIGGVLACGLSGPRRPFAGSARDYVLGMRVINGQGQDLSFGGQVMKNVAGYDVSRVQVGAWGTLGVLVDTSMKVLPKPELEITLCQQATAQDTASFAALLRQPLPLSAAMLIDDQRYLRLSGSESAVRAAAAVLGGEEAADAHSLWTAVRDQTHEFFATSNGSEASQSLWRISVPDGAGTLSLSGSWLHEWAGAQRWLKSDESSETIFAAADAAGGHAMRYTQGAADEPAFQPLQGPMQRLQSRVRDSFDPQRILNRGRFHPELD